jgi:hypothetical protein
MGPPSRSKLLEEHNLFGKTVSVFRDHPLAVARFSEKVHSCVA